jgi:hypothetical protein
MAVFLREQQVYDCPLCLSKDIVLLKTTMSVNDCRSKELARGIKGTSSQWLSKSRQVQDLKAGEGFILGADGIGRIVEK